MSVAVRNQKKFPINTWMKVVGGGGTLLVRNAGGNRANPSRINIQILVLFLNYTVLCIPKDVARKEQNQGLESYSK
jgi:hypothetical protein